MINTLLVYYYRGSLVINTLLIYYYRGPISINTLLVYYYRGSLVIQGSSRIVTSSFRTGIDYSSEAASVINFQTYTDFYDKVKMCLQMSRPDFKFK